MSTMPLMCLIQLGVECAVRLAVKVLGVASFWTLKNAHIIPGNCMCSQNQVLVGEANRNMQVRRY